MAEASLIATNLEFVNGEKTAVAGCLSLVNAVSLSVCVMDAPFNHVTQFMGFSVRLTRAQ